VQIVGYETGAEPGGEATRGEAAARETGALFLSDGGDVERVGLAPGTELAYTLGTRHCAGTTSEGTHVACDAEAAPYCPDHRSTWPCALCSGGCSMPLDSCHEEHAIYLAAFAPDAFKVGVTRTWRLETRLREQGADRAAHVRTVKDGRIAREIEARLSRTRGIPDRVRVSTKLDGLHRPVDEGAWTSLLDAFDPIETFAFDYGLELTRRPMAETIATGTVRGTKGRLLVLDRPGGAYAVDLRDLVGYEVDPVATDRDVQSSFAAFE
jgi:hypothetical protein